MKTQHNPNPRAGLARIRNVTTILAGLALVLSAAALLPASTAAGAIFGVVQPTPSSNDREALGGKVIGGAEPTPQPTVPMATATQIPPATSNNVIFTDPDTAVCQYDATFFTVTGHVTILESVGQARLQLAYYIVHPKDRATQTTYVDYGLVRHGDTFSIQIPWPGIRPTDQVVENHIGGMLLDARTGNPIMSQGASLDYYWYPWFCPAPTPAPVATATPLPPGLGMENCTYTQGYWKNHQSAWPVNSLVLGNVTYTMAQLINILNTSTGGDASRILAQQLIAAKLNIAHGADPAPVQATIASADAWLIANPVGSKPKNPAKQEGTGYATLLDKYNNGFLGVPHCGDTTPTPAPTQTPAPTLTPTPPAAPTATPVPPQDDKNVKKVTLCHSTSSRSNPYNKINVSINSVENAISVHGHGDHVGPIFPADNWGDIIPPFTYKTVNYPGMNWTAEGIAIWEAGCNVPNPNDPPNRYDYTCQKGAAVDSSSGLPCTEGYYGTVYDYHSGTWWTVNTYCMTRAQCEVSGITPGDEEPTLPCVPQLTPDGFKLVCEPTDELQTWNVYAEVSTSCPVNEVIRSPYPRSMVNVETTFVLQSHPYDNINGIASAPQSPANLSQFVDQAGNPTKEGYEAGVWKDLRLYMRSRRFNGGENWFGQTVPRPQWTFTDRAWNTTGGLPAVLHGTEARYVYQTSSAGLDTRFGRAFDLVNKRPADTYNLPAYSVNLATFCGYEWKATVKLASKSWIPSGPCYQTGLLPHGETWEPAGTSNQGCAPGWVSPGTPAYIWRDYATDWVGLDLREAGNSTSYDVRTRTTSGGMFKGQEYWDEVSGIWVPVVEVQSVLRAECVSRGTCAPPAAMR